MIRYCSFRVAEDAENATLLQAAATLEKNPKLSALIRKNLEFCNSKQRALGHLADIFVAFLGAPDE